MGSIYNRVTVRQAAEITASVIRRLLPYTLALAALFTGQSVVSEVAAAQSGDLVLLNARIIVGTGQVIEKGSIVIRSGRIQAVTAGSVSQSAGGTQVDVTGMTLIAGYIDCHRHLIPASRPGFSKTPEEFLQHDARAQMLELLESGVTTVQSGGDNAPAVLKLKRMTDSGQIKGPRIISSAWVMTSRMKSEAEVRTAVDAAHTMGADSIAEVPYPSIGSSTVDTQWPFNPTEQETRNLAAELDEAKKLVMPFQVHAVSPMAQVAAVRLGARRLIHSSHYTFMIDAQAKEVAGAGAMVASSNAVPSPVFDIFNHENSPRTATVHRGRREVLLAKIAASPSVSSRSTQGRCSTTA